MPDPLLPDLSADWKAIRRLTDAIFECVDNTVADLIEGIPHALLTDEALEELTNRVANLAIKGEHP